MKRTLQFASDNHAGICPEAWAALVEANTGHATAYGYDAWTRRAEDAIRALFDADCAVYFVFTGTAANALSIAALCRSTDAVLTHASAHINVDECGASSFFSGGVQVVTADTPYAKLTPEAVGQFARGRDDEHASKPRAVSVTQATELGTVFTPNELRAVTDAAHAHGLFVHVDGARFANAVASLECAPADLAQRAGVDVLSLGGTKNGLPLGEAIVFFDRTLAGDFKRRRMQGGQLASKMRFLAAPWLGILRDEAWLQHAAHANAMATRLATAILPLPGIRLIAPVEANGVFADLPHHAIDSLRALGWEFHVFVGETGVRFMCAWDTTTAAVDALAADLRDAVTGKRPAY